MTKTLEKSEKIQIDKRDKQIIQILEHDGRISILKLAKQLKLSHETVRYRINKLTRLGVIEEFSVRINKKVLGYNICAVIMVAIWNYTREEWQQFLKYLMDHDNVLSVAKTTGDFDLKIGLWVKDTEELDTIFHSIKTKHSKIIKDWQTFIFTATYKRKELPF